MHKKEYPKHLTKAIDSFFKLIQRIYVYTAQSGKLNCKEGLCLNIENII